MPNYLPYDYSQNTMVVINYLDQLQAGTFEHALYYLIDKRIDLTLFDGEYRNDDVGRPAYDPAILLKVILFAYSKGITSSRTMQWCCETNIIFKALSCDSMPHFTTIADFVSRQAENIQNLFEQILLICHEQGLLGNELFAIDGCKTPSNAAKEWSGTFKELKAKREKIKRQIQHHMTKHQQLDLLEKHNEQANQRIQKTIETLNHASDKIESFLVENKPRQGQGKRKIEVKSNITDNESAKMTTSKGTIQGYNGVATVDKKHQIIINAQTFGAGQEQYTLLPVLQAVKETYNRLKISKDIYAEGTIVTADTGFANEANMHYLHEECINAYIPDNQFRSRDPKFNQQKDKYGKRHQQDKKTTAKTFPAELFDFDAKAMTCECPAGQQLPFRDKRKDNHGHLKVFFSGKCSQCKHCSMKYQCMRNPAAADDRKGKGRQVSFILKKSKNAATYTDWMKERVDSEEGKQIYSHRMSVVEPVFGNIGTNKRLNRFSLRSQIKVQAQWRLYCVVHNIEKLANYGQLAG